jgi:glyoxylase-like metal-dependent hydrolase (beta-lactamase superfamily II)/rhodanese-related sulfurtransferase
VPQISPEALLPLLDEPGSLSLLDVRTSEEFIEWSIPGARNLPLDELERLGELDELEARVGALEGLVAVICAAGARAQHGADLLEQLGVESVIVTGGMAAWGHVYDEASIILDGTTVVQLRRRGKGCLSYVIGAGDRCVVIDPPSEIEHVASIATSHGWNIVAVADTHLHADHVSGARLLAETTGAALVLNDRDGYLFEVDQPLEGEAISLGPTTKLSIGRLATPGHTRGSTTFALGDAALFTGDTLFLESVGRPDLADQAREFAEELYGSLHERLLSHPDATMIFPGHVGSGLVVHCDELVTATLGELRERLEALSMDRGSFVDWAAGQATPRPPNYVKIVETNRAGSPMSLEEISVLEAGPNRCAVDSTLTSQTLVRSFVPDCRAEEST